MRLSTIRRILKEDLARSGDLAKWVDALLSPLNEFIDQVVSALRNNLTFVDNFACKLVTQKFVSGTEYEINPQSKTKVSGVLLLDSGGMLVTSFGFYRKTDGNVGVKVTFSNYVNGTTASGVSATMSIAILFG